jgi:hypothetical protein
MMQIAATDLLTCACGIVAAPRRSGKRPPAQGEGLYFSMA